MRTAALSVGSTKQSFTFYVTAFLIFLVLAIISQRAFNAAEGWANRGVQGASAGQQIWTMSSSPSLFLS